MATSELKLAIAQVASEKGISPEDVLNSIKLALIKAYAKEYNVSDEGLTSTIDEDTFEIKIFDKDGKDITPPGYGRIAANKASQVLTQAIRESEKLMIQAEYKDKIGTIVTGTIFRIENGFVIIDLGKTQAIMPYSEQVQSEAYRLNQKLKVIVKEVRQGNKGMEVVVSRSSADFVARLFEAEVPEIANGTVEIIAIAREAGSRTKMAVYSNDDKIDPVGSCVGQKGVRVQSIIQELFGEKIDIIPYATSIEKYIASALSPARVTEVEINDEEKAAVVYVPEDQQSLAIGKDGQNVRLAHKLTKWKIEVKGMQGFFESENTKERSGSSSSERKETRGPSLGIWDEVIAKTRVEAQEKEAELAAKAQAALDGAKEESLEVSEDSTEENTEENKSQE